jgi:tetratricopeptide (TPR) repeat protein
MHNSVNLEWRVKHPYLAAIVRKRKLIFIAMLLVSGLLVFGKGVELSSWKNQQVELYNQGIDAYVRGDFEVAVELFDQSIAAYEQDLQEDDTYRFIYGSPSRELAALANFQKGKAYLLLKQVRPAVEAYMESLRLNPGNDYTALGVPMEDVQRLFDQALIVKYDLEFLFKANKSQSQKSDQGQPGQPGDQGDTPVPGSPQPGDPGKGQGEGGGDDL